MIVPGGDCRWPRLGRTFFLHRNEGRQKFWSLCESIPLPSLVYIFCMSEQCQCSTTSQVSKYWSLAHFRANVFSYPGGSNLAKSKVMTCFNSSDYLKIGHNLCILGLRITEEMALSHVRMQKGAYNNLPQNMITFHAGKILKHPFLSATLFWKTVTSHPQQWRPRATQGCVWLERDIWNFFPRLF